VIGAVIGIGLAKGAHNIRVRMLGRIGTGWVATPVISAATAFVLLFFVQNVFSQQVYTSVPQQPAGELGIQLVDEGLAGQPLLEESRPTLPGERPAGSAGRR
jgi:hypothetical protein